MLNPAPPVAPTRTHAAPVLARLPVTLRPDPALLTYYVLSSLVLGPAFFLALIPMYFRYRTLQYEVEAEGITMRWGILFRREVSLTYARIQDIHLTRNFVERWLGLARIQVQTASGSSSAEMTVEGIPQFEAMRDFLYTRMRGARDRAGSALPAAGDPHGSGADPLADVLREIAAEVRAMRAALPSGQEANDA